MIKIVKKSTQLLLRYEADQNNDSDVNWIDEELKKEGCVTLRRTFTFDQKSLVPNSNPRQFSDDVRTFVLAEEYGGYYKIDLNILELKYDLLVHKELDLEHKHFVTAQNISIFKKIDTLSDEQIVVGGDKSNSIPIRDFEKLLRNFPTATELKHYANARIAGVLKDYLGTMTDAQKKLDVFMNRKRTIEPMSRVRFLKEFEIHKFEYVRDELKEMLEKAESYSEKDWQKLIVGFLLLIFPKYIAVLENLHVKDFYSNKAKASDRYVDLVLVDANGTIDIIEIKKPFENCVLSRGKYRGNFVPCIELSGSVMQVEKYIFHLNKWGREGEKEIMKKRKSELPENFDIKVTNPKAIVILGRSSNFKNDQKFDLEIIKRKYANIIDIMTYDDLLSRLENIISMIKSGMGQDSLI